MTAIQRSKLIEKKAIEICSRFASNDDLSRYINRMKMLSVRSKNRVRSWFLLDLAVECQLRVIDRIHLEQKDYQL